MARATASGEMADTRARHLLQVVLGGLRSLAAGIRADQQAVTNGLTLPWNSGKVEGTVNKIKMIKRQMYGRAGFDMLRKRVILHPA